MFDKPVKFLDSDKEQKPYQLFNKSLSKYPYDIHETIKCKLCIDEDGKTRLSMSKE